MEHGEMASIRATSNFAKVCFQLYSLDVVEAGLVSAAVLISFGVLIGKVNPFQLLVLGLLEAVACIANMHLGYTTLGVVDVGGSIFVHTFGAYFGLAVSFCLRYLEIIRLPLTKSR